jgi:5'/3'-nucleotidase
VVRALVTNDDGIDSSGLAALTRLAVGAGLEVVVAAPSEQSSGASAAITAVRDEGRLVPDWLAGCEQHVTAPAAAVRYC